MRIGGFPSKMGIQHHIDNEVIDVKIFKYPRHIGRCLILDGGGIFIKRPCIYSNVCIEVQYQRHIGINPIFHGDQGSSIERPYIYIYKYIHI